MVKILSDITLKNWNLQKRLETLHNFYVVFVCLFEQYLNFSKGKNEFENVFYLYFHTSSNRIFS